MNIYFLTEDSKSFRIILPEWLHYVLPDYVKIKSMEEFQSGGNYYMVQDGGGYPRIKKWASQTIETFTENSIPLDYFVILWDGDAKDEDEIQEAIKEFNSVFTQWPVQFQYRLFVMRHCFETWLLGNRAVYPHDHIARTFAPFAQFYNVSIDDPEQMLEPEGYTASVSTYHRRYLQEMLRNSIHKNYSKGHPAVAAEESYWDELCLRVGQTLDLRSFANFLDFLHQCGTQSL